MKKKILFLLLVLAMNLGLAVPAAAGVFADVDPNAFYADAVTWAVENGIVSNTGTVTFSPDAPCTRGEFITFLWRRAGSPDIIQHCGYYLMDENVLDMVPEPWKQEPWKYSVEIVRFLSHVQDVAFDDPLYPAVIWAETQEIFDGSEFRPNDPCTRLMVIEFMWKMAGSHPADESNFSDVDSDAVDWAVGRGIDSGTSAAAFSPDQICTRGEAIAMLYRYANVQIDPSGFYISEKPKHSEFSEFPGRFLLELSRRGNLYFDFYDQVYEISVLEGSLKGAYDDYYWGSVRIIPYQDYVMVEITDKHNEYFSGKYTRISPEAASRHKDE